MNRRSLFTLSLGTFLVFGILLSIGISISARDEASNLDSRVSDIEYRIEG